MLEELEKIREYFSDQNHWCTGTEWRDDRNYPIYNLPAQRMNVCKCCLSGAIIFFSTDELKQMHIRNFLQECAGKLCYVYHSVVSINDALGYDKVIELLDYAIGELKHVATTLI